LIDLLEKYSGKKCLILGCGPSLKDVGRKRIMELSKDYVVVTIKQSYLQFKEKSEFQFFNCNNFMNYTDQNSKFVCCSPFNLKTGRDLVWDDQKIDYYYQITNPKKLSQFETLGEYFDKVNVGSYRGPGIMYEIVLPFLYNIGIKEFLTVGWDYHASEGYVKHFYNENSRKKLKNPAALPYLGENAESIENSKKVKQFFDSKGILLRCMKSDNCYLDSSIQRIE